MAGKYTSMSERYNVYSFTTIRNFYLKKDLCVEKKCCPVEKSKQKRLDNLSPLWIFLFQNEPITPMFTCCR